MGTFFLSLSRSLKNSVYVRLQINSTSTFFAISIFGIATHIYRKVQKPNTQREENIMILRSQNIIFDWIFNALILSILSFICFCLKIWELCINYYGKKGQVFFFFSENHFFNILLASFFLILCTNWNLFPNRTYQISSIFLSPSYEIYFSSLYIIGENCTKLQFAIVSAAYSPFSRCLGSRIDFPLSWSDLTSLCIAMSWLFLASEWANFCYSDKRNEEINNIKNIMSFF